MAGLGGQIRTPQAPVRERRNADNLAAVAEFVGPGEVIQISGDGVFTLSLRSDGGLENDAGELAIDLDTNPGLSLSATGLKAVVAAPITLGGSGIGLNIGSGLFNSGGALTIDLADSDSGLTLSGGELALDIAGLTSASMDPDADSLVFYDASLMVHRRAVARTVPPGRWAVTAVQTTTYSAAFGELVRADPSTAGFTINLPSAASRAGEQIRIKNVTSSTNTISVAPAGAETIDGAGSATITTGFGSLHLISDGSNWLLV